jgi:glutaredoxin-like protein NrdH
MQKPIKLYTLSTCIHCRATKSFLDKYPVKYEFTDVDLVPLTERESVLTEIRKYNPACTFPTILIGDQIIIGFDQKELSAALVSR